MSSPIVDETEGRSSNFSAYYDANNRMSFEGSPMMMSPWLQTNPYTKVQWSSPQNIPQNRLIGSLVREEGHIYSLAASGDFLYTGSDSKNIRVWKNMEEFSAFKSNSGLVKAIIVCGKKVFTGHQDGKVRVWKTIPSNPSSHRRSGTLPTRMEVLKASMLPRNYVEVKRNKTALWIRHSEPISCLSMCAEQGLLYSASWDRTFKVWRIKNSKCLESVKAHDDAVNAVVASADGLVYSGCADGTVKVWKRESRGRVVRHKIVQTLPNQEYAVTALTVDKSSSIIYVGTSDGLVTFWERENELIHGGVLKGHTLAVLCLSAAGNLVFSGSADRNICVWRRDGNVHSCLSVLTGHTGPVKCLAVEEDKKESTANDQRWVVYSGSLDKSVKVWSVSEIAPNLEQMALIQQGGGGDFTWGSMPSLKY